MSHRDFFFGIILLITLVSRISASCLYSMPCACGSGVNPKYYTQCINSSLGDKYACESWANCETCEANRTDCLTCPPGRTGPTCADATPPAEIRMVCPNPTKESNLPITPRKRKLRFKAGRQVKFTCKKGFKINGTNPIICRENGEWSSDPPNCIKSKTFSARMCPNPGPVENGGETVLYINLGDLNILFPGWTAAAYAVGTQIIYYCNSGYRLDGNRNMNCTSSGKWSGDKPVCTQATVCPNPGSLQNGGETVSYTNLRDLSTLFPGWTASAYAAGTEIFYHCNSGYRLEGNTGLNCTSSGNWSGDKPRCIEVRCKDPGSIKYGGSIVFYKNIRHLSFLERLNANGYPVGSRLIYACENGYHLKGERILFCISTGSWSGNKPKCIEDSFSNSRQRETCPDPGLPNRGYRENTDGADDSFPRLFQEGETVHLSCDEDSVLIGPPVITCTSDGIWSDSLPRCEKSEKELLCPDPGDVENAWKIVHPRKNKNATGYPIGTRISYTCNSRYLLEGEKVLNCISTGSWSGNTPRCIEECGRSPMLAGGIVRYGTHAKPSEFPWVVFLFMNETGLTCGGALLDQNTVLSAAHCFKNVEGSTLYFGKYDSNDEVNDKYVVARRSFQIIVHPDFNEDTYDNDIAIVTFYPNIEYSSTLQPICVPSPDSTSANVAPGQKGYVTGWGLIEKQPESSQLTVANVTVEADDICTPVVGGRDGRSGMPQGTLCALFPNEQLYVCNESSGSPLVMYNPETERFFVQGLVSQGLDGYCDQTERYAYFTRVSHYLDWIYQNWIRI